MTTAKRTRHGRSRCRAHPTPTPQYRPRSAPARTARRRCRVDANRTNTVASSSEAPPIPAGVEWLTPNQAAQHIQIPARQLQQWRYLKKGPPYSLAGRAVRYRLVDLDAWLIAHRVEPTST